MAGVRVARDGCGVAAQRRAKWQRPRPAPARDAKPPLSGLKNWVTVGTPFLHFIPDVAGLLALLPLLGAIWVFWRQGGWFRDYWATATELSHPWPLVFLAVLLIDLAMILAPALALLLAYRVFLATRAQEHAAEHGDLRAVEARRLLQAAISTLIVVAALGLPWLSPSLRAIGGVVAPRATRGEFAGPVLLALGAAAVVGAGAASLLASLQRARECRARLARAREAWNAFGDRYHYIACRARDEAITGLRKTQHGIRGPLLPRLKRPGEGEFAAGGRSIQFEAMEGEAATLRGFSRVPTLPFRIAYDWLFRPLYNEVFAVLVDGFVLGRFAASAHGSDLPGLRLGWVSSTPVPVGDETPGWPLESWSLRDALLWRYSTAGWSPDPLLDAQLTRSFAGPTPAECQDIQQATHTHAAELLEGLRSVLGVPSAAAVSLKVFLLDALREGGQWTNLLIHTTYFDKDFILRRIAAVLRPSAVQPRPGAELHECVGSRTVSPLPVVALAAARPDRTPTAGTREAASWPPPDFGWGAARGAVRLLLLCTPPLLLLAAGWLTLYPSSREASLAWATSPEVAVASVMRDVKNQDSGEGDFDQALACIRWYAGVRALRDTPAASWEALDLVVTTGDDDLLIPLYAKAGQKLAELGDYQEARHLLQEAIAHLGRAKVGVLPKAIDGPDLAGQILQNSIDLATLAYGLDDRDLWRVKKSKNETFAVVDRIAQQKAAVAQAGSLLRRPAPADVTVNLKEIARACAYAASTNAREAPTTVDLLPALRPMIARAIKAETPEGCDANTLAQAIRRLVVIDQSLLASVPTTDRDWTLNQAQILLGRFATADGATAVMEVELRVLLAKSHRWPLDRRPQGFRHLDSALRVLARGGRPDVVIPYRVYVACGYARLGLYPRARELAAGAGTDGLLLLAIEILAREYEESRRPFIPGSDAEYARLLTRVRSVFDEQADPLKLDEFGRETVVRH